jgi:hypothetical protein
MNKEQYEILNKLLHRIARVIGRIVKRKKRDASETQKDIEDLELAREEALQLAEKINNNDKEEKKAPNK